MNGIPAPLVRFFGDNPRPALAFSGGTDSAYLLYVCATLDVDVAPFFFKGEFQTDREIQDAGSICARYGMELNIIEGDVLSVDGIASNGPDRCYNCKKLIMGAIKDAAEDSGRPYVMDGTNASDPV